jgi:hypothetical protein
MKTRQQINKEAEEIYFAILEVMKRTQVGHCQSWWLNSRNFNLKSRLTTPQINQRAKLLVKQGYLFIDKSRTSTATGTCYRLTDKSLIK